MALSQKLIGHNFLKIYTTIQCINFQEIMVYLFLHCSHTKNISLSPIYRGSTRALQGLYKDSTRTLQGLYKDSTRTLQGLYKEYFRHFHRRIYFLYGYNVKINRL